MRRGVFVLAAMAAVVSVLGATGCSSSKEPKPAPGEAAKEKTGPDLDRGKYLVEGVMHCFACHSQVDWQSTGLPPLPGMKGAGAMFPDKNAPGRVVAPNITPDPETGIGRWSDAEVGRAIREGIGRDGRRLFPAMPYLFYRHLSDDDLAAVIAYIRSIPAVRHELPATELPEPVKAGLPPPMPIEGPVAGPDPSDRIATGAYLAQLGDCGGCHTPLDPRGQPIPGLDLGGGAILEGPWGRVASANITPDASGIPYYDANLFIDMIHTGNIGARTINSVMLWGYYRHMTDDDLAAIFAWLRTVPAVSHEVNNTDPPTACPRCGNVHGAGERNH